jgi:hypothetical protein
MVAVYAHSLPIHVVRIRRSTALDIFPSIFNTSTRLTYLRPKEFQSCNAETIAAFILGVRDCKQTGA